MSYHHLYFELCLQGMHRTLLLLPLTRKFPVCRRCTVSVRPEIGIDQRCTQRTPIGQSLFGTIPLGTVGMLWREWCH
jgi:hypothetical protein